MKPLTPRLSSAIAFLLGPLLNLYERPFLFWPCPEVESLGCHGE